MQIYEAGIIIGGVPIISANYINPSEKEEDLIHKCALLSCLLNFAETLIAPIESFESNKYNFAFKKSEINTINSEVIDIFVYLILNKDEKFNKYLDKKIKPVLDTILDKFKVMYHGRDFSYSTQFIKFKDNIDNILLNFKKILKFQQLGYIKFDKNKKKK
ncbi:MAG: hypothetical protein KGD57_08440 [Candidatus Lokiarchaeota archaeon]|nr:hypothetical protein [Candidatus Lokiarchaeota archaeon]